jgi:uncharacterized protein YqgC (DUF456 family)
MVMESATGSTATLMALLPDIIVESESIGPFAGPLVRLSVAALFGLLGIVCVVLTAIGLPGLWLLLLLAGALQFADRFWRSDGSTFAPLTLGIAVAAAVGAEALEFIAGARGAQKAGASRRGMVGAMVGGIVGALLGAPFGLLVGAIIGGVIGSAVGAIVMEMTRPGQTLEGALRPAHGAAMGRLQGVLGKLLVTIGLWLALTIAAVIE